MIAPHIHVPFDRIDRHMDLILDNRLNLEIYFSSACLDSLTDSRLREVKSALVYGPACSIHAPFMDLSPAALDSKIRTATIERIEQILHVAEEIKPLATVFHSGYEKWKYALDISLWLEKSLETWRPMNERFAAIGTKIGIENIFEDEPTNLRRLMEEMDSDNFGICFDTGHCNLFTAVSLDRWLDELGRYIIELHLHDNDTTADQHFPPGDGSFDFERLFSRLGNKNIIYTLEAHTQKHVFTSMERFKILTSLEKK
jgi:sugar phosphate isomerase/epimerase